MALNNDMMKKYEIITGKKYKEEKKKKKTSLFPEWIGEETNNIAPTKKKWFKGSQYFDNGYDFGDVTKTILSTSGDVLKNIGEGFLNTTEGVADTLRTGFGEATKGSANVQAAVWDFLGNEAYANKLRKAGEQVKDYTYKNAQMDVTGAILGKNNDLGIEGWTNKIDEGSVLGTVPQSVAQGIGNIGAFVGLGQLSGGSTLATFGNSFASAYGNTLTNGLRNGLDEKEAKGQAITSGLAEAISEQFFQGIPGLKSAGWADNLISKPIGKYFSGATGKVALKVFDSLGEGFEEVISNVLQSTFEGIRKGDNVKQIWDDATGQITNEETRDAFVSALISSALTNGGSALITNAQKNQIIDAYAKEHDMTTKETKDLFNSIVEKKANLEETSNYKERVETEEGISKQLVKDLQNNNLDLNELYKQTPNSVKEMQFTFNQDEAKNVKSEKQNVLANDMARLNNEKSNHELYKVVNAIQSANDTQQYHITTTEGLYEMGIVKKNSKGEYVMPDGSPYVPRGLNYKNGEIYINADVGSQSGTQAVYHEMFEGFKKAAPKQYKEFKQMVTDIIGEETIQKEFDKYKSMYGEELTDDIRDEIINDKFGELAENQNFINRISDNRNVLEKLIDSIKNMIKYVKGTDEERQLMKLQKKLETEFAKRYKETDFSQGEGDTAYSLTKASDTQREQALKLQKEGKSAEDIYLETGAYEGADGRWRTEIDDSGAKIKLETNGYEKPTGTFKLKDILEHPKLYKAYPEFKNVNVVINPVDGGYAGMVDSNGDILIDTSRINLNEQNINQLKELYRKLTDENNMDNKILFNEEELKNQIDKVAKEIRNFDYKTYQQDLKSTLLHEIQHKIQHKEGFTSGTNLNETKAVHDRYIEHLRDLNTDLSILCEDSGIGTQWVKKNMPRVLSGEITLDQFFEEQKNARLNSPVGDLIKDKLEEKENYEYRYGVYDRDAYDLYQNTAGEIEAREVQKRMNMSPEERAKNIPFTKDEKTVFNEPYYNRMNGIVKTDTKYSLTSNKDSQGRDLTPQQQEYFKDSKVVDDEGNLKVVYRGSSTEKSYNVFDTDRAGSNGIWFGKGFYFAGELDHALTYAKNNDTSNIYEVYLNLTNPYIMDSDTTNPDGTIEFAPSFYEQIENKFGDYLPTDWKELNSYQKGRAAQNALMDNGYDGVIAGDTYVAYNSNQIKNVDNTNPTTSDDIRYSLAPAQETKDLQTRINESMTMDDMKRILDIAFSESDIEEYSDGAVKTVEEWLNNDDWNYQISLIAENSFTIIDSYLNRIGQFDSGYNEDFTFDDILEAYKNGTLVGHQKATRSDIDTSINTGRIDNRFYAPQFIEATRELYDKANQRVTNSNRNEVYKARADFIIAAHNPGMAEQIGITQQEVNKKLRTWANYPQDAMDISNRVNEGVARENQWSGLENSSIVNYITVSDEQLRSMVKEIRGKSDEYDRKYITSTMLALDTHIDYSSLTFEFGQKDVLKQHHANGDYYAATDTIRVGDAYQNTVAHEMGHYLNSKWARDIFDITNVSPLDRPLTHMAIHYNDEVYKLTDSQKQFLNNFTVFVDDLVENAVVDVEGSKSNAEYWQDRDEVFARFVAQFTEWTKNKATNGRFNYESQYHRGFGDSFTQRQYMNFIKILQEKAALEASGDKVQKVRNSLTSNQNIESKEIAPVKTMEETIAPIREDISNISKQMNDLSEQIKTLQNQPETASDNDIAPYNPYRARAIAEREANQVINEMQKDENYWKSLEQIANEEDMSALDDKSARKLSRNIGKELGLKQKQVNDLQNVINDAFNNGYSLDQIKEELYNRFGHDSVVMRNEEAIETQKQIREYRIKVSPEIQKNITDYGYWKQQYFGKIKFSKEGSPVDVVYAQLSEQNPGMFPDDIWNETDQLLRIAEVADMDRKYSVDYEMNPETINEAANYINDTIQETLYANAMKSQTDLEKNAMQYNERTQDIPIKKKTRQEVRENLQNTMGITTEDLQAGNDIKSFSYQMTTPERVNEKVFGREIGRKINEQTVYFAKHQEAERIRFLNKERQEIKDLGIKARSKESELVQKYGEGLLDDVQLAQAVEDKATQDKIKNAARVLRQKYDNYLDMINEELVDMGYDAIPKRKDYMRHFQELTDKFSQAGIPFNRQELNSENLPTDINGLTEFNVPGKNWFASAQKRTGEETTYDAITGIDGYLEGASNLMYHTETIQRYRALEKLIRDTYGQTHGLDVFGDDLSSEQAMQRIQDIQEGKLSNYAAWLKEQGNALAGKKATIDRGIERALGRRGYTFLNTLKKQTGSNMTGFNVRSALTNFISSTIAASKTNKIAMVKGTVDTIKNIFHDDGFINRSDFLTSRFGSDALSQKTWQKISNAGQIFMSGSDWFTSNLITRSKYYEGLSKGMTDTQAMNYANDFAARVMGDRSKGATAEAFNSKTLGLFTQFQLETNNQWQYMIHDTKMEYQENVAKDGGLKAGATLLFQMGQLAAYSYLFNEMFEKLTGSRAAFDIADIFKKIFGLDDDDKDKDFETRLKEASSELVDALPFASLFGSGGRMPIGEMLTPAQALYDYLTGGTNKYGNEISLKDVKKDALEALPYYVLPTGYSQLKKAKQGLGMYDENLPTPGSYTDSGNLRFTADEDTGSIIKNALFGQWSGEEAKKYIESGYKTIKAKDIPLMKDLDMSSSEFKEFQNEMKEETTTTMEHEGIKYNLYLDDDGNKYWYDKSSRTVYDDKLNPTDLNVLSLEKANVNELKYDYVSNLDIDENTKQKLFDELFSNTTTDKYGYKKYIDENNKTYWYDEDNDTLYNNKYNKVSKNSVKGLKEVAESKNMSNYKDYGSYEEFDYAYKNPGKYKTIKSIAGYDNYKKFDAELKTIRDNTKQDKKETIKYVNSLDLTIPQKAMFIKQYYPTFNDYNKEIVNYVANLDIDYNDKVEILKSLKFKVDKNGNVTWK